jgi:excisionase family DNA binding protein
VSADTVTLQEAADRLGVHYMTAYRYVRLGLLPAEKVGGTWRVEVSDLDRMKQAGVETRERGHHLPAPWAARLENRLRAGDELGAWGVVEAALSSGTEPIGVYLDVIGPALRGIGDGWEGGEIDVGVEHRASVIVMRLLGRLGPRFARRGRPRGTVLLGAPPGEHHGLPVAMLADIVRGAGFTAVDLGADVPTASFVVAASTQPVLAVVVSVTTSDNESAVQDLVRCLHEAVAGVPVLVGGGAVGDEPAAAALGADGWAVDARGAVRLLDAVHAG